MEVLAWRRSGTTRVLVPYRISITDAIGVGGDLQATQFVSVARRRAARPVKTQ
jgi:hypothetical protein